MDSIILHNMIVEARRNGYESEMWKLALQAVDRGMLIDDQGLVKEFI